MYAKCSLYELRKLWRDLEQISRLSSPWIVGGDSNNIREDPWIRIGGHPNPLATMEDFNQCINNCGLLELKAFGRNMSLCNGQEEQNRK